VLEGFEPEKNNLQNILHKNLGNCDDRSYCTELVMGVGRNRAVLDEVINRSANLKAKRISKRLENILRIGAYELIYCSDAPDYAVVNEAVNIAVSRAGKKGGGFVNAVLRQITRHIANKVSKCDKPFKANLLPVDVSSGCEFDADFFADFDEDGADYLSQVFSLPLGLVEGWVENFGIEKTAQICFASNRRPGLYVRANVLQISAEQLCELFAGEGIESSVVGRSSMVRVYPGKSVKRLAGFDEGFFSVQDLAAYKVVEQLKPCRGDTIVDLCAAPGGKTTHAAELVGDEGKVIATDINSRRLKKLQQNVERLKLGNVHITGYEDISAKIEAEPKIDAVILDVPCSNTGTLARRIESRYSFSFRKIDELRKIQFEILLSIEKMLKKRAMICYSTCSIEAKENQSIVKKFLETHTERKLVKEFLTLPQTGEYDHDGGYIALIN